MRCASRGAEPNREALEKILGITDWWYHSMELGHGLSTPGHHGMNLLPVAHLLEPMRLDGLSCLDVGTMDGKLAFLMEKMGGRVLAVDGVSRPTVEVLAELYGSSVGYRGGIWDWNIDEVGADGGGFDFLLCVGVLYHVFSPLETILRMRKMVKNGGYILFESLSQMDDENSQSALNRGDLVPEYTTLWVPSIACLRYMVRFSCMSIIAESTLQSHHLCRHAILAKAEAPSILAAQVEDPWLQALFSGNTPGRSHEYLLPQYDLDVLNRLRRTEVPAPSLDRLWTILHQEKPETYAHEEEFLRLGTPAAVSINEDIQSVHGSASTREAPHRNGTHWPMAHKTSRQRYEK